MSKPTPEIARELGVDGVMEGSVLRAEGQVRITVQLIHGPTDRQIWARNYERDLQNILRLQGDVARAVAAGVEGQLTPHHVAHLSGLRTVDPVVHDTFLRGRVHMARFSVEGVQKALQHFGEALDREPDYAPAMSATAWAWILLGQPLGAAPHLEAMSRARDAATRALRLDDGLPEAHSALGLVQFLAWDWLGAQSSYRRALEENPNAVDAHWSYGLVLSALGRHEEGIEHARTAVGLDPFNVFVRYILAEVLFYARELDASVDECGKALELDPGFHRARWMLRFVHEARTDFLGAARLHHEDHALVGGDDSRDALRALDAAVGSSDPVAYWTWRLDRLRDYGDPASPLQPLELAMIYAALGEHATAMDLLESQFTARSGNLAFLNVLPPLDPLRGSPRFEALVAAVGLPTKDHDGSSVRPR